MALQAAKKPVVRKAVAEVKKEKIFTFTWEGSDRKGQKVTGQMSATNQAMAKANLRKQGITPTKVKKKAADLFAPRKKPVTPAEIASFSRMIATMMKAGIPLVQSFEIIGKGHDNPSVQELLLSIKTNIESGTSFAEALRKYPRYFDDLFCDLVDAGEQAGALEEMLDRIATYKEKSESLKKKIKKALTYPIAVLVIAVVVTSILLIFVVPTFKEVFGNFGADLPAFTLMVIGFSEWMQAWWWAALGVVLGILYSLKELLFRSEKARDFRDRLMLKLPAIGPILYEAAVARYARTLSTTFAAGVPLVEALESAAGASGNVVFRNAIHKIRDDVSTGMAMHMSMESVKIFPNMVVQMVGIGEESGSLDAMLSNVAGIYEENVDNSVDNLSALLEPMIMAVLGVLVGGLIIAMYLPIFTMGQVVG